MLEQQAHGVLHCVYVYTQFHRRDWPKPGPSSQLTGQILPPRDTLHSILDATQIDFVSSESIDAAPPLNTGKRLESVGNRFCQCGVGVIQRTFSSVFVDGRFIQCSDAEISNLYS